MKTTKDTNNFNLENWVIKTLKSDPELAQEYITQAVETFNKENNIDSLISSLEKIIQAKGKDYFEMNAMEFTDKKTINNITDFEVNNDVLWFTHGADPAMVSVSGNHVIYGDHKIAKLIGLTSDEMQAAVDTAQYI